MNRISSARLRALALGSCLLLGCSSEDEDGAAAHTASGQLRFLSYNVAGLPAALSGSQPDVNMPLISPLLNDYDIVVVQEDWLTPEDNPLGETLRVYHDLLAKDATHPYQSVPAPLPFGSDPRRPSALMSDGLNRFSMVPFGELTRVAWEGCFGGGGDDGGAGDCLALKGFSVATHTLADGVEVDIYNLHGEAGATETDQQLSAADFEQLAAFLGEHSAGRAVIVAGDTNLHTDDGHPDGQGTADKLIWDEFQSSTGLADVCAVVSPCDKGIDKLAVRSNPSLTLTPVSQTYAREKFRRADGADLSDHPPLVVELSWSSR